ncbi:MAG: TylF/MycF family methyltransferase [Magnetococcus sp. DMHC-6]
MQNFFLKWIKPLLRPVIRRIRELPDLPFVLRFVGRSSGKEYGVGYWQKWRLARRIINNSYRVRSGSHWKQHLKLVDTILGIPKDWIGDVVECGCYQGASSASLSIVCALVGRRLFICDSFAGLPEPEEGESHEIYSHDQDFYYIWEKGEFTSVGGQQGVRQVIQTLGEIEVCHFVAGYFQDSLPTIPTEDVVMVFEDADLASSVRDCLQYLWPKLHEGARFYSHEPWSIHVVSLFYDKSWWTSVLGDSPPGFHGSGQGVPFFPGSELSFLGYAEKINFDRVKKQGRKLVHHGSSGYQEGGRGGFVDGKWRT